MNVMKKSQRCLERRNETAVRYQYFAVKHQYLELAITSDHTIATLNLKKPDELDHNDPFDKLLLSQAKCEKMMLCTSDKKISKYEEQCIIHIDIK